MTTTTFVASVKFWNVKEGGKPTDKNGHKPLVLIPFGGKAPRGLNVISGSSALLQGFLPGKCYIVTATERPLDEEHGRQFNFESIAEVNPFDALTYSASNPTTVLIQKEVAVEGPAVDA